jgi:PPK2 family polyphosphate:nucleotide phosphotransferase
MRAPANIAQVGSFAVPDRPFLTQEDSERVGHVGFTAESKGLRVSDCGLRIYTPIRRPKSEIRNPQSPMSAIDDIIDMCRVPVGNRLRLRDCDPAWAGDKDIPKAERKAIAEKHLTEDTAALAHAQELLYASDTWSVLVILQALDAAGKDGTIKHVMSGVNPQGCQVFSFKHPSAEELDHDFLWRCVKCLPERGRIGIFNRSYYEEVLIVKVHPHLLDAQRIPGVKANKSLWESRYEDINALERHLTRNGTAVVKFFLHVSKGEQRERFLARINEPAKHWKFSAADVAQRAHWDDYMAAYEDALSATSTEWAPWYVIPADHKWVTRALVAKILVRTIQSLGLAYPEVTPETREEIAAAKAALEQEED